MSNKDFQNGFALGLASGGVVSEKMLDHTVTFMVDGEPYEVVSVKDGNQVNEPTEPKKEGMKCVGWSDGDGNAISFPITPSENITVSAILTESLASVLVNGLGINYEEFPHVIIGTCYTTSGYRCSLYICDTIPTSVSNKSLRFRGNFYMNSTFWIPLSTNMNTGSIQNIVETILNNKSVINFEFKENITGYTTSIELPAWSTFDFEHRDENISLFD